MNRWNYRRPAHGNGMLYMLALHSVSQFMQQPRHHPVTATLVVANTLVHFRPGVLDTLLPTVQEVCLNPHRILKNWDVKRLFLSAFFHLDDAHLVYNMTSLLWKGLQLEGSMGSRKFAGMVTVLLGLSHGLVVLFSKCLEVFADNPEPMYSGCAVGFSAVLFALKMVLNSNSTDNTEVYGFLIPSRHAAWAELIAIQMFVPGASFLGHFSGIVAGLLYVQGSRLLARSGSPFRVLKQLLQRSISFLLRPVTRLRGRGGRGRTDEQEHWRCPLCTYLNSINRVECAVCGLTRGTNRENSGAYAQTLPDGRHDHSLTLDELRQARVTRLDRRRR